MMMKKLCVLVCPMDWGLGHASRCVPVIKAFLAAGCRVLVGVSGPGAELVRREFGIAGSAEAAGENGVAGQGDCDILQIIPFPGFSVTSYRKYFLPGLLLRVPAFLRHISMEKRILGELVEKYSPDLIVSDNRYGLVHERVTSVIITHQLRPSMPLLLRPLEGLVSAVIRRWAGAFDECWIPDCADDPAAGRLTAGHERLPAAFFTGWLSRFSPEACRNSGPSGYPEPSGTGGYFEKFRYRFLFLLSGPEPHRTMLEDMVKEGIGGLTEKALLVRGLPGGFPEREIRENLEIVSFVDSGELQKAIGESEVIVCRSGYSSVMDLLALGRTAVLVPTPGQTEQEYLGKWLASKGWFRVIRQKDFHMQKLMAELSDGFAGDAAERPDTVFGGSRAELQKQATAHKLLLEQRVKGVLRKVSGACGRSKS